MSILITSNGSPTNNGYLHLTTDTRTVAELSSGPISTTVLHTDGSNMFEVQQSITVSLAGGTDMPFGATWLTGNYCRNAKTIPGWTSIDGIIYDANGQSIFNSREQLVIAYVYDTISGYGCSTTGQALMVFEAGTYAQGTTTNLYACGLGTIHPSYSTPNWFPSITFNTSTTEGATMWNNREHVEVTLYITNGIVNLTTGVVTIPALYTGYDVDISNSDVKINNVSIFNRKIISCSSMHSYFTNNIGMSQYFSNGYSSFSIYNAGKTGHSPTPIESVYITKDYIAGTAVGGTFLQYIGGNTSLRYSTIVMLSVGQSYTLPAGGTCFAAMSTSADFSDSCIGFQKIHSSMADGVYYLITVYFIAGGNTYSYVVYLNKVGNILTLQISGNTGGSPTCALVIYNA